MYKIQPAQKNILEAIWLWPAQSYPDELACDKKTNNEMARTSWLRQFGPDELAHNELVRTSPDELARNELAPDDAPALRFPGEASQATSWSR